MLSSDVSFAPRVLGPTLLVLLIGSLFTGGCTSPEPVPQPTMLNAVSLDGAVRLRWSPGDLSAVRDGYHVYRDTVPIPEADPDRRVTGLLSNTTYVDSSVENGTTYHYRVGAVNEETGVGPLSDEVTVTPFPDPRQP